jgi:hypothetical protein
VSVRVDQTRKYRCSVKVNHICSIANVCVDHGVAADRNDVIASNRNRLSQRLSGIHGVNPAVAQN